MPSSALSKFHRIKHRSSSISLDPFHISQSLRVMRPLASLARFLDATIHTHIIVICVLATTLSRALGPAILVGVLTTVRVELTAEALLKHDALVVAEAFALDLREGRLVEGKTRIRKDELSEALPHFVGANEGEVELSLVHEGLVLFEC